MDEGEIQKLQSSDYSTVYLVKRDGITVVRKEFKMRLKYIKR